MRKEGVQALLAKYVDESRKGRPRQDSCEMLSPELCPVSKDSNVRRLDPAQALYICVFCARHPNPAHRPPAKRSLHIQAARTDRTNNDSRRRRIIRRPQVPLLCSRHLYRSQHCCGSLQLSCKSCPDRRNFGTSACCPLSPPYKLPPRRAKDLRLVQPRVSARLRIETRQHEFPRHTHHGKAHQNMERKPEEQKDKVRQPQSNCAQQRSRRGREKDAGRARVGGSECVPAEAPSVLKRRGGPQVRNACARGRERGHAHGPWSEEQTSVPRACGSFSLLLSGTELGAASRKKQERRRG